MSMIRKLYATLVGSLISEVPGHRGVCYPTWINRNVVMHRLEGPGVSGFFKLVSGGPEFHGIVWEDGKVWSTEGVYSTFRGPDHTVSKLWCSTCTGANANCPECHGEGETRMSVRERAKAA